MSLNVLAINTSRRKKNTYSLIKQVCEGLNRHGINSEIINLFDYDIKPCIGCQKCITDDYCVLKDDVGELMHKLIEADGIILSSPVYMNGVSGKGKTFFDRTCKWFHRPELYGKPMLFISTTAGSGLSEVTKYLNNVALQWGCMPTGSVTRIITTLDEKVRYDEYKNFVRHLKMSKAKYKPKLNALIMYQVQRILAKKILQRDRKYWIEKNWLNKMYFFNCDISISKRVFIKMFAKILDMKINQNNVQY